MFEDDDDNALTVSDDTSGSIFDDADTDTEDVVFLTSDNAADLLGRFQKPYFFDAEKGRPREGFYVRMAEIGILNRFLRRSTNNKADEFRDLCALIADAVVSEDGQPIWTEKQIANIAKANAPRFMRLQEAVLDRNNLKRMASLVDDAAKN